MNKDFEENELKDDDELVSYISVTNKNPKKRTPKTMNWIFVRMFLMNKPKYEDCSSDEERCIWMIRNVHKLDDYPSWVQSAKYKGFAKSAEIANFDAEKHRKYQKAMLSDQRIASIEAAAEKRGRAEGRAEGEAKGRLEGAAEIAKALLLKGTDIEVISFATGLTKEQIAAL